VRKRDPRYKAHLAQAEKFSMQASGSITPAEVPRKPTVTSTYVEQEWQRVTKSEAEDDLEWAVAEGENTEEWECVACAKTFRSEAAWDSHERSKKHLKEVERLRREMCLDEEELDLTADGTNGEPLANPVIADPPEHAFPVRCPGDSAITVSDPPNTSPSRRLKTERGRPLPEPLIETEQSVDTRRLDETQDASDPPHDTEGDANADDDLQNGVEQASTSAVEVENGPRGLTKREKRRAREAKKMLENKVNLQVI
jgi:DnaJ family protein A protein 5